MPKSTGVYSMQIKETKMITEIIKTKVKYLKLPHYIDNDANLTYSTPAAVCFDICAAISEPLIIKNGERFGVPTGVVLIAEPPLWFRVDSRSGLALKNGIIAIGGIIDNDYRGELKIILLNTSKDDYTVNPGDKIAQVELPFPYQAEFKEISQAEFDELSKTSRGAGGFGSSGR